MWWVHHIDDDGREHLRASNITVPLLPEAPKKNCNGDDAKEMRDACESIQQANVLDVCHKSSGHKHVNNSTGPLPTWPATFQSKFQSPSKQAEGIFAIGHDASGAPAEVLTLTDGTRDHLCAGFHNDTACTMLTTRGWKWLVWPDVSRCCKCCSDETDCGPLVPTWLQNASGNIFFEGVASVTLGAATVQCRKWAVLGLKGWKNPNYYYEHLPTAGAHAGLPCEIDGYNYMTVPSQRSDDQYIFVPESFSTSVPPGLFDLPAFCKEDSYCGAPLCDALPVHTSTIFM